MRTDPSFRKLVGSVRIRRARRPPRGLSGQGVLPSSNDGATRLRARLAQSATGEPIGTGRLLPDGRIGRMAVIASWRGRGRRGDAVALMDEARRRGSRTHLHAQTHAKDFYAARLCRRG
jgi:predicted GNAT family N-acyltransferase